MFLFCLLDCANDAGGIVFEVAVGGINLTDSDAHHADRDTIVGLVANPRMRYIRRANPRRGRIMVVQRS